MKDGNAELRALTGLRGVAALTVALAHYNLPIFGAANRLFFWHSVAVDLFFCLSGFTLALVYVGKPLGLLALWNYGVARFARIYPLYIASLLAMAFIRLPIGQGYDLAAGMRDFVLQVLMVNAWPFGTAVHWNIPAWSISVEWFCYIFVFPWLWFAGARIRPMPATLAAGASMAVAFVALAFFFDWEIFVAGIYGEQHHPSSLVYAFNVVRGSAGFVAGWAAFSIYASGSWQNRAVGRATDAITVIILALIAASALGVVNNTFTLFFFPPLVLGLANEESTTARALASPLVHKLGLWSYSIYMLHAPTRALLDRLAVGTILERNDALYATAVLSALVVVAAASYRFFETPWRQMLRDALQFPSVPAPTWWSTRTYRDWPALVIGLGLVGAAANLLAEVLKPVALEQELLTRIGYIRFLRDGWGSFEKTGSDAHVWGVGRHSSIVIDIPNMGAVAAIELRGDSFVTPQKPGLFTRVALNGKTIATIDATLQSHAFDIAISVPKGTAVARIDLATDNPTSPKALGLSGDDRELTVSLTSIRIREEK